MGAQTQTPETAGVKRERFNGLQGFAVIAVTCWSGISGEHRESLKAAGAELVADGLADDRLTTLGQFS